MYDTTDGLHATVFIVENDGKEREALRAAVAGTGCAVIPLADLRSAEMLLSNRALCDLIIVSTDVLAQASVDEPDCFDTLLKQADKPPAVVIYGIDPAAKIVVHCLNKGARDFLAKPFNKNDLVNAVENAVCRGDDPAREQNDAIVASSPISGWVELTASSELEQLRRLQRFSDALFASRLPHSVCEDLKMAVEEVGRNAVEWGNRFDPDKQVHISYCIFDDRVVIKIEDEGEGFKPQAVPDPTADPLKTMQDRADAGKRPGGYGVYLIQKLVDDVVYSQKGNTVLMIKYLPEKA